MARIELELNNEIAFHLASEFAGMCHVQRDTASTEDIGAWQGNIYRLRKLFTKEQKENFKKVEGFIKHLTDEQAERIEADMIKYPFEMVKEFLKK